MNQEKSSLASSLGLAFFVSLAGLLLIAILSLSLWKDAVWFAMVYASVVSLMTGAAVRLGGGRWQDVVLGLCVCALVGSSVFAWTIAGVRTQTLHLFSGSVPTSTLFLALDDPSEDVSIAACNSLLETNFDALRHRVGEFAERKAVTVQCLSRTLEETDADELMRKEVLGHWLKTLKTSNDDQCELVEPYASLELVNSGHVAIRLLRLVTEAHHPGTRDCAREEFQRRFPTPLRQLQALGNPTTLEPREAELLFHSLTNTSYSPTADSEILKLTSSPLMKQWGLSLGCFLMENGPSQAAYAQKLNVALSLQNCGLEDSTYSAAMWSEACSVSTQGSSDGLVTTTRLCRAIAGQAMIAAVGLAQSGINGGLDAVRSGSMVEEIHRGTHRANNDAINSFMMMELDPNEASPLVAMEFDYKMTNQRAQVRSEFAKIDGKDPEELSDQERERFMKMAEEGKYQGLDLREEMGEGYDQFLQEMNSRDDESGSPSLQDLLGR